MLTPEKIANIHSLMGQGSLKPVEMDGKKYYVLMNVSQAVVSQLIGNSAKNKWYRKQHEMRFEKRYGRPTAKFDGVLQEYTGFRFVKET